MLDFIYNLVDMKPLLFMDNRPYIVTILSDAMESVTHLDAVPLRFFANYQEALNVYN